MVTNSNLGGVEVEVGGEVWRCFLIGEDLNFPVGFTAKLLDRIDFLILSHLA